MEAAKDELQILKASGLNLSQRSLSQMDKYGICISSSKLLERYAPLMLEQWTPVSTVGDGNCLFRAVSTALYGVQDHHAHLRLLASLEIGCNPSYYEPTHSACHTVLKNHAIVCPPVLATFKETTQTRLIHVLSILLRWVQLFVYKSIVSSHHYNASLFRLWLVTL